MTPTPSGESTFYRMEDERDAPTATGNCEACWHLWSKHGRDGCTGKVYPAHSLTGEPCPCEGTDPVLWEQDREAERHQAHLDRVHGGSDCDCVF